MPSTNARTRPPVGYDDPRFEAVAELATRLRDRREPRAAAGYLLCRPRAALAAFLTLRGLPRLELRVSRSGSGQAIRERTRTRVLGVPTGRVARAALVVPVEPGAYLRGRRRQAARTNVNRARRAGVRCLEVTAADEQRRHLCTVLFERGWGEDPLDQLLSVNGLRPGADHHFVAVDANGHPLVVAVVVADVQVAHLAWFMASASHPDAAAARYALTAHIVSWLSDRGCRVLIVDSALTLPPGLRYFQQRVGFQPYNLSVRPLAG